MKDINYIINLFSKHGHKMPENDIKNLDKQINRKGSILYEQSILFLAENNINVNYDNVKNLIKTEKKISNLIWVLFNSLEENIKTLYVENEKLKLNWDKFVDLSKKHKFNDMIISLSEVYDRTIMDEVRWVRNKSAHLNYFILNNELPKVFKCLDDLKKLDWIDFNIILICKEKIKFLEKNYYKSTK